MQGSMHYARGSVEGRGSLQQGTTLWACVYTCRIREGFLEETTDWSPKGSPRITRGPLEEVELKSWVHRVRLP